jgi:predicted ATP-dependent Lon-type protease
MGYFGEVGYAITPELKIFDNYEPNPKPAIDSAAFDRLHSA